MDTKNVVAAISLSVAVIVFYSLFFMPEPSQRTQSISEKNKIEETKTVRKKQKTKRENSESPTLNI